MSNTRELNRETNRELSRDLHNEEWTPSDESILKEWSDKAICYRWLYEQAYHKYNRKLLWFMIPVIVLSTITGTANFAQDRLPEEYRGYFAMAVGGLNLFTAILTTVAQFLKVSELKEGFNSALKSWDKFNRAIKLELMKKHSERPNKKELINNAKKDYDKLVDESPILPPDIIILFNDKFKNINPNLILPEICDSLQETKIYKEDPNAKPLEEIVVAIDEEEKFSNEIFSKYGRKPTIDEIAENK